MDLLAVSNRAGIGGRAGLSVGGYGDVHRHGCLAVSLEYGDGIVARRVFHRDRVTIWAPGRRSICTVQLRGEGSSARFAGSIHALGRIGFVTVLNRDGDGGALGSRTGSELGLFEIDLPGSVVGVVGGAHRRGDGDTYEQ